MQTASRENDGRSALTLGFKDLSYTIVSHKGHRCQVLHNISGECRPGRLFALMGPSGAGKTSLIAILARHIKQNVTGVITLNGTPLRAASFRRHCSYVPQMDILLSTATVREAITTAALLRLPKEMKRSEKDNQVQTVIQQLELEACQDTLVGDEVSGIKGISGGERRRLSVALGLVTDPSIILLDEPTSGLDSETALQLMKCLKRLTLTNCTVIASIHQPAAQITDQFDDLLLLANGRSVFCGPWADTLQYLTGIGFPCPAYTGVADFFLTIVKESGPQLISEWQRYSEPLASKISASSAVADDEEQGEGRISAYLGQDIRSHEFQAAVLRCSTKPAAFKTGNCSTVLNVNNESDEPHGFSSPLAQYSVTRALSIELVAEQISPALRDWSYEVWVLFVRFLRTWYRAPNLMLGLIVQYLFSGTFLGLMYLQLGNTSASSIFDRQSSLFLIMIMLGFTPSNASCTIWNAERQLLRRDSYSGMYKISAYFAAKTLFTIPSQAFVTTLFCLLVYYMIGYQNSAPKFLIFWATTIIYQLTSENIGLVSAVVTKTATTGLILSATIMMILVAFSGFLIDHTPVFFRWIPKASFVTFAYSAIYQNEFHDLKLNVTRNQDGSSIYNSGILVDLGTVIFQCLPSNAARAASKGPGGNNWTVAENIIALSIIFVCLRIFTFCLLFAALKFKKL